MTPAEPTTPPDASAQDVAKIARGLTKAQRALIPRMSDGGLVFPLARIAEGLPDNIRLYRKAAADLRASQLATFGTLMNDEGQVCGSGTWLTPLGLAVRQYLLSQESGS